MSRLPRRYRYQYRCWLLAGDWNHSYEVVGRWGALHFHVTDFGADYSGERYSAGLEIHYRQPPDHMADDAPSHDECWLLKAPCWHDGTTKYAMEQLLPMFDGKTHEHLFMFLAGEADERFGDIAARAAKAEG